MTIQIPTVQETLVIARQRLAMDLPLDYASIPIDHTDSNLKLFWKGCDSTVPTVGPSLTATGNPSQNQASPFVDPSGMPITGTYFSGSTGFYTATSLDPGDSDDAIIAVMQINPPTNSGDNDQVCGTRTTGTGWAFFRNSGNEPRLYWAAATTADLILTAVPMVCSGVEFTIWTVDRSGYIKGYVNGNYIDQVACSSGSIASTSGFGIAESPSAANNAELTIIWMAYWYGSGLADTWNASYVADFSHASLGTIAKTGRTAQFVRTTAASWSAEDRRTTNPLIDGDMEKSGTSAWTAGNSATLTKDTSQPHGGDRSLRVTYNGTSTPYAYQSVFTSGRTYRIRGWARGDGTRVPSILNNLGTAIWTGTAATTWQLFDFTFAADGTNLILSGNCTGSSQWVEYDDVSVSLFSRLNDADMEASDCTAWTDYGSPTKEKITTNPHSGTRCMKITVSATNNGVYQNCLTKGKLYRIHGFARSDGTCTPRVMNYNGGAPIVLWDGTTDTGWVEFDVVAQFGDEYLILAGYTAAGYVVFDDVEAVPLESFVSSSGLERAGGGLGQYFEGQQTNECYRNINPSVTTGVSVEWANVDGQAGTLSVESDTTALAAVGMQHWGPNVFKVTGGETGGLIYFSANVGNSNNRSFSILLRTTAGSAGDVLVGWGDITAPGTWDWELLLTVPITNDYMRLTVENETPMTTDSYLGIVIGGGDLPGPTIYFIAQQIETSAFCSSTIPNWSTSSTATRNSDRLYLSSVPLDAAGSFELKHRPMSSANAGRFLLEWALGSYLLYEASSTGYWASYDGSAIAYGPSEAQSKGIESIGRSDWGGRLRVCKNGVSGTTQSYDGLLYDSSSEIRLGYNADSTYPVHGYIRHVKISRKPKL